MLAESLVADIDAARRKTKTAHTDQAMRRVRQMIEQEEWQTAYVTHRLGLQRLRWLMSQGIWQAQHWLRKEEQRYEQPDRSIEDIENRLEDSRG